MPFRDCIGHQTSIAFLQAAVKNKRLAHAYLFHGEEAIGKRLTALRLAQALSCEQPSDTDGLDSCGACRSCRQIEAHTHPDFFVIEPDPEQATRQIKIEQVREIEHQIMYRPLIGERKICLIDDADRIDPPSLAVLAALAHKSERNALLLVLSIDGDDLREEASASLRLLRMLCQRVTLAALLRYGASDLVCYRASEPASLAADQARAWQPLLDWLASAYAARLAVTSAVASCVTPGPQVAVQTPGVRVTRAQPSAIPSPAPSWRTSSILTPPSLSSSCIQYMFASPMMPNVCVTPSALKLAASLW